MIRRSILLTALLIQLPLRKTNGNPTDASRSAKTPYLKMPESSASKKVYSARQFNRVTIVCPSCLKRFKEAEEKCPSCAFDAQRSVQQFAMAAPVMERFMDQAGLFAQDDEKLKADLDAAVDALGKQFPQLGWYFCTLEPDELLSLPEYGFWMMNACLLQDGQDERERAWSLLLLMDVKRGVLSLTPGYAIEAFIDDLEWEKALKVMAEHLSVGDYRAALLGFVRDAGELLRASAQQVNEKIKRK